MFLADFSAILWSTSPVTRTLAVLARIQDGGIYAAAAAVGIHPHTMGRAAAGCSISPETRDKLERHYALSLEELQRPFDDAVAEVTR